MAEPSSAPDPKPPNPELNPLKADAPDKGAVKPLETVPKGAELAAGNMAEEDAAVEAPNKLPAGGAAARGLTPNAGKAALAAGMPRGAAPNAALEGAATAPPPNANPPLLVAAGAPAQPP